MSFVTNFSFWDIMTKIMFSDEKQNIYPENIYTEIIYLLQIQWYSEWYTMIEIKANQRYSTKATQLIIFPRWDIIHFQC